MIRMYFSNKIKVAFLLIVIFSLFCSIGFANNLQINNADIISQDTSEQTAVIQFDIS